MQSLSCTHTYQMENLRLNILNPWKAKKEETEESLRHTFLCTENILDAVTLYHAWTNRRITVAVLLSRSLRLKLWFNFLFVPFSFCAVLILLIWVVSCWRLIEEQSFPPSLVVSPGLVLQSTIGVSPSSVSSVVPFHLCCAQLSPPRGRWLVFLLSVFQREAKQTNVILWHSCFPLCHLLQS